MDAGGPVDGLSMDSKYRMNNNATGKRVAGKTTIVAGAGGNIGSHLVPHLGRMAELDRVILIDPDIYEAKNVWSQEITPRAVGKLKACVQAHALRQINPRLQVEAVPKAIQDVPLGRLHADVILACLDSREARLVVNQASFRLGVPWLDAGVEPRGLLARVTVYLPTADAPCLECGWHDEDYALLEQLYACGGEASSPAPTNAPSSIGALAASLQAIECQKLLTGQFERLAAAQQVLIDASHHKHYVTKLVRNGHCRFDHEAWCIFRHEVRSPDITVGEALGLLGEPDPEEGSPALWVEGQAFVVAVACARCGWRRRVLRLQRRLRDSRCAKCGGRMVPIGFEMVERLDATMSERIQHRTLRSLGLRAGDVFSVGTPLGSVRHYEIDCDT